MEKKFNWILVIIIVVVFLAWFIGILTDFPVILILVAVVLVIVIIASFMADPKVAGWFWGGLTVLIITFTVVGAVNTFWSNWTATWPVPEPPAPKAVWVYENVGWPGGILMGLVTLGFVFIWMRGLKGIMAAVVTVLSTLVGAMIMHQTDSWGNAFIWGLVVAVLSLGVKLIDEPSGGAAPLVMTGGGLLFGGIFMFVTPLQSWVVMTFSYSSPVAGIVAIAAYSAAGTLVSAVIKSIEEGPGGDGEGE